MPDESNRTAQSAGESPAPPGPDNTRVSRLLSNEERLWRGGLIAALLFLAISILASGHRHRPPPPFMGPMAMAGGWGGPFNPAGPMMFASPYPPPWAMGGACTCGPRNGAAYPGPGPYAPPPIAPQGAPRG